MSVHGAFQRFALSGKWGRGVRVVSKGLYLVPAICHCLPLKSSTFWLRAAFPLLPLDFVTVGDGAGISPVQAQTEGVAKRHAEDHSLKDSSRPLGVETKEHNP